jgi:hypothetical protein
MYVHTYLFSDMNETERNKVVNSYVKLMRDFRFSRQQVWSLKSLYVLPCIQVDVDWHFRGVYYLHHQCDEWSHGSTSQKTLNLLCDTWVCEKIPIQIRWHKDESHLGQWFSKIFFLWPLCINHTKKTLKLKYTFKLYQYFSYLGISAF